jgi:hypothetical protein
MAYFFKYSTQYLLIIFVLTGTLFAIEIDSSQHAVDVAGKQRMFTQRMLKDYAMIGMENSFGKPQDDLIKIMEDFENHLEALHNYTKNKKIKISTDKIKNIWLPIKKRLKSQPSKKFVGKLQEDLEVLLKESNHATKLFAKDTGEKSGEIIDVSGRQRMLSQRMAGLYMLKVWGVDDKKFEEKMSSSMKLFKDSLERLKKSELNTVEITELLTQVEKSFMFFEIMNRSSQTFIPALISKKSYDILNNMNSVTKLYVSVSKK